MKTTALPTISGATSVTFKHEGSVNAEPIGPVHIFEQATYAAWIEKHGIPHTNGRGETKYMLPFGAKPDGRHDLGWKTRKEARDVAVHYGVTLQET